jgi:hypothetical protein
MAADAGEVFKPGETCKQSGIYKVVHDPRHTTEHEVTVVNGEPFPPCNGCGQHPRFTLVYAAHHLHTHEHFKK